MRALTFGLGLVLCLTTTARESLAQAPARQPGGVGAGAGPGGLMGGGMAGAPGGVNLLIILMAPAVQQELKLTDSQKTQVFDLTRGAGQRSRDLLQSVVQSGNTNPQALMVAGGRMRQENERAVAQILQPEQKERAEQIILRVEGPLALARPEIASKLGLSPNQTQQIQMTMVQMMQTQREIMMAGVGANAMPDPNQGAMFRKNMNQLRDTASQQLGRILNGKQKAAFNQMLGEPFDISKIDPDLASPTTPASTSTPDPEKSRMPARKKAAPKKKAGTSKDGSGAEPGGAQP